MLVRKLRISGVRGWKSNIKYPYPNCEFSPSSCPFIVDFGLVASMYEFTINLGLHGRVCVAKALIFRAFLLFLRQTM